MKYLEAKINCPSCHRQVYIKVKEMIPGRYKKCPHCGTMLNFTGDDGRRAQKALDDLERSIKKLNRKLKIKL